MLKVVDPSEIDWNSVIVDVENLLVVDRETAQVIGYLNVPQYENYKELSRRCKKEVYAWGVRFC